MRNVYKIIVGMLVAGVLLAGVGSGVAFAEYSSFEYGGEQVLENSRYITKKLSYKVSKPESEDAEKTELNIEMAHWYYGFSTVEDTAVPKDEVRFEIQYLSDRKDITPKIVERTVVDDDALEFINLNVDYEYNDFRDVMRVKNPLLEDLKAHRICDYQMDGIKSVEIHVNPDADFILHVE